MDILNATSLNFYAYFILKGIFMYIF